MGTSSCMGQSLLHTIRQEPRNFDGNCLAEMRTWQPHRHQMGIHYTSRVKVELFVANGLQQARILIHNKGSNYGKTSPTISVVYPHAHRTCGGPSFAGVHN